MERSPIKIFFETEVEPRGARPRKNRLLGLWDDYGFGGCVRVESREDADWCLVASTWNDFVDAGEMDRLVALNDALRGGPRLLVWAWGDEEVRNPLDHTVVFQTGTSRHFLGPGVREVPYTTGDPVAEWFRGGWEPAPVYDLPTVAFCGRGGYGPVTRAKSAARRLTSRFEPRYRHFRYGDDDYMALRGRVLSRLEASSHVVADVHAFDRFGGGIHADPAQTEAKAKIRFVNNLRSNVYGLCVRGAGNFSTRFYECLACGRVPVLVDTDSVLPGEDRIDWDPFVVRVQPDDPDPGAAIAAHRESVGPDDLEELQAACRRLWLDELSREGFARNMSHYLG